LNVFDNLLSMSIWIDVIVDANNLSFRANEETFSQMQSNDRHQTHPIFFSNRSITVDQKVKGEMQFIDKLPVTFFVLSRNAKDLRVEFLQSLKLIPKFSSFSGAP
jgi:hypothetical protein